MKGAKKIFYNKKKACPCLSSKWRNRWGVGGRTTGHFGTSVTGITHNRLCFPTRRRNWYCRQYKWSSWHKCYMIWVEENSDKRHGNSNRIPVLGKSTNMFDTYMIVTLKLRKLVRRCQSNVEFQLLWQQLLLKLFVKNFITSILPHKGGSDQEGPQPENHTPIISLLLKTYKRMALLVNSNNEEQRTTVKELWQKTTIIMTDSVEKNLHIENGIAAELDSSHIPLHLPCKAHTVEALNRSNINVLASLESFLKFREAPESINPGVKSFIRSEKLEVLCTIMSILNFASHDKSSSSTNQAELFEKIKSSTYHTVPRACFTKLGYSCVWILHAMPCIQMVLTLVARPADEKELECGQIYMTLWNEPGTKTWYIGYCIEMHSDEFRREHIHRATQGFNLKWRYTISSETSLLLNLTKSLIVWLMGSGT